MVSADETPAAAVGVYPTRLAFCARAQRIALLEELGLHEVLEAPGGPRPEALRARRGGLASHLGQHRGPPGIRHGAPLGGLEG